MTNPYRAMCAELLRSLENYPVQPSRDRDLCVRARALLAQPEPAGLSDEEIEYEFRAWWNERYGSAYFGAVPLVSVIEWTQHVTARRPTPQPPADGEVAELVEWVGKDRQWLDLRRDVKDRILRIADLLQRQHLQPEGGDIHYAWELHDAEGDWQAGGSAITLESVRREGNHYLQTYSQDGPHTLIIQRVSTIEEVTNDVINPPVRYVLHPGYVTSASDGQEHFIDGPRLARLHGLNILNRNVVFGDKPGLRDLPGDIHLRPRFDGDYSVFTPEATNV